MTKQWLTLKEVAELGEIVNTRGNPANYMFIRDLVKTYRLTSIDVSKGDKQPRYLVNRKWVESYLKEYQSK